VTAPAVTVIVLAGGQNSRMGRDKALVTLGGTPLLARVCQAAVAAGAAPVRIVTPRPARYRHRVPTECTFCCERDRGQGPLAGLVAGLERTETEWALVLACDLAGLNAAELRHWMAQLPKGADGTVAQLPFRSARWEPLCGFYRRDCLPSLRAYLESGQRSLQGWLAQQPVRALAVRDPKVLWNCNAPADLAARGA